MEAQAKAAEEERKNNPEDDQDHDTRKLPKPERMRLVMKNKEASYMQRFHFLPVAFMCWCFSMHSTLFVAECC